MAAPEGGPRPLALFDAVRVDFSLRRLVHYTGSDWRAIQPWILFTNYQRYVDQFVRWGAGGAVATDGAYRRSSALPAACAIDRRDDRHGGRRAGRRTRPGIAIQMPAYHLMTPDGGGVTLVNIGVGPSNAKTITDHLAVLRPHCWLMIGHCGGLRQSQTIGDYVLAHGYLRRDRILDDLVPPEMPVPALAEVQVALQEAAALVTGERGDALKRAAAHRHGGHLRRPQLGAALVAGAPPHQQRAPSPSTWKAPPSPPRATACACPTARCCASPTSRCTARSSCPAPRRASTSARSASTCRSAWRRWTCCAANWRAAFAQAAQLRRAAVSRRRRRLTPATARPHPARRSNRRARRQSRVAMCWGSEKT